MSDEKYILGGDVLHAQGEKVMAEHNARLAENKQRETYDQACNDQVANLTGGIALRHEKPVYLART